MKFIKIKTEAGTIAIVNLSNVSSIASAKHGGVIISFINSEDYYKIDMSIENVKDAIENITSGIISSLN